MKHLIFGTLVLAIVLLSSVQTNAQVKKITVTNSTSKNISSVYISTTGTNSWGSNLYTKSSFPYNETFDFMQTIDNVNCSYDVRYIEEDGTVYVMPSVNLCNSQTISLTADEKYKVQTKMEKY